MAGALPQGHPRDPGRHRLPASDAERPGNDTGTGGNTGTGTGNNTGNGNNNGGSTPRPRPTPPKTPEPNPSEPGSGTTPPPPTTNPPTPPGTPTDSVHHLENAGAASLTAMAGDTFTGKLAARTETKAGKAVAKVRVRFTVVGGTDTTFTGGEKVATVLTDSTGKATAPALVAGEKTGDLTIRTTVVGRAVAALDHRATVTARRADALTRVGTTALTCVPGGEFAEQIEVKATYRGEIADRVAATATLVTSLLDATENDKGPYFEDADGEPVRTFALETDAGGALKLPKLYADDATGTFLLRIQTEGGATLTLELKVEAPAATAEPTGSDEAATPSPGAS